MNAEIKTPQEQAQEAQQQIPSGMQAMMRGAIKMLGLDPQKIEGQIREFTEIMLSIGKQLSALLVGQEEIKSELSALRDANAEILKLLQKEKTP